MDLMALDLRQASQKQVSSKSWSNVLYNTNNFKPQLKSANGDLQSICKSEFKKNEITLASKQPSVPGEQANPGRGTKSSCGMTSSHDAAAARWLHIFSPSLRERYINYNVPGVKQQIPCDVFSDVWRPHT